MVKTPRTRHSKTTKEPVTIDLAPGEVARVKADQEQDAAAAAPENTAPAGGSTEHASDWQSTSGVAEQDAAYAGPGEEPADAAGRDAEAVASDSSPEPSSTTSQETETPASSTHRPAGEQPRRRGSGVPLAAGLAGGVLALALAGALQVAGLLPVTGGTDNQDAFEARLDQLQEQVVALQGSGDAEGLSDRLAAAEDGLASLTSDLAAMRNEIAGLADGGGEVVDLAPLEERIAAIETAIAGLGGAATPEAALAALDEQIETLRSEIAAASDAQSTATARLNALERSVSDMAAQLEQQAETPATAVIIAASALKAAIDRGGPFMTELETFASLAPEAPEVAQLRDMAAAGVPTRAQIAAESDDAANAMIAAARPSDPEAGIIDRLWGSAMGLVQVRPIGMVEGEGVSEIVARLDSAVTSNDYQRAIDEFETLPEAVKAAGEPFMAKVRARHGADTLIDQALAAALKV
jgi:hypothetical protein